MKRLSFLLFTVLLSHSQLVFAEIKAIECQLQVQVRASQNYAAPIHQYTTLKNDGSPMLLIGINIQKSEAIYLRLEREFFALGISSTF